MAKRLKLSFHEKKQNHEKRQEGGREEEMHSVEGGHGNH